MRLLFPQGMLIPAECDHLPFLSVNESSTGQTTCGGALSNNNTTPLKSQVLLLGLMEGREARAKQNQDCMVKTNPLGPPLLDPHQSGFKVGHSTETALLAVTESLHLLDLSAAFDTVNHQILLSTLEEIGISGSALSLFASYLTGRSYQVTWRGATRIAACLADILKWMATHHLKLNLDKTELLFLLGKGCPHRDLSITIDDTVVTPTRTARNLGVTLDDQLSFSANIAAVKRSCRFLLYNIRRIRPFLTDETAQVLIQALVISHLDYCNSLLAGAPATAIRPLELVQKAAARHVFNRPKFSNRTSLLRSLHWLPVRARIQFKPLVLAYRAVKGTDPYYLQAMVKPYTPARPLRSAASGRLVAPSLRGPCGRSTRSQLFSVLAPQWWIELPTDIRTAESLPIFRRRLKTHLFK
ncbi:uncharacterized protein, partial [Cebidichthys violaceus]|uniref:uncharacterized protein n=1 Tax=Cebidichthys violaceus TaxID=271503 RepID=UPI0035CB3C99